MRVMFVVTGVGYGDATREMANIRELLSKYPKTKIMVAGYDNSYEFFKNMFHTIKIRGYTLPGKKLKVHLVPFMIKNLFLPIYWFFSAFKIKAQIKNFKPDIIVSDFEPSGLAFSKLVNKKCITIFGYDPLTYKEYKKKHKVSMLIRIWATYFEQIYKDSNVAIIPKILGRKYRGNNLLYTYVDSVIRNRPEDLADEKTLMKKHGLKKKPIIIMLGGSKYGVHMVKSINAVAEKYKENFIIFGGEVNFKLKDNVKYIPFSYEYLEYLKVAKGVITQAGQKTIAESLVFKKPLMLFPVKNHVEQILNAYEVRDYTFIAKDYSTKGINKQLKEFLKNIPSLQRKVNKLEIETKGSEQIVKVLEAVLKKN